jgi:hypothetical protein
MEIQSNAFFLDVIVKSMVLKLHESGELCTIVASSA